VTVPVDPIRTGPTTRSSARASADNEAVARSLRPRGPARLKIVETQRNGTVALEVSGEFDVLTGSKLASALDEVVRRRSGDLLLDLSSAAFIDSFALYILLNAQRRLSRRGRGFSVVCDRGPVRRVIELARLADVLGMTPPPPPRLPSRSTEPGQTSVWKMPSAGAASAE
jgi:anti-anti-sigma factor